jgi:hypothetical protein
MCDQLFPDVRPSDYPVTSVFPVERGFEAILLRRLLAADALSDSCREFMALPEEKVLAVRGVGKSKWDVILRMKKRVRGRMRSMGIQLESDLFTQSGNPLPGNRRKHLLNYFPDPKSVEQKVINRLLAAGAITDEIRSFFLLTRDRAMEVPGIGPNKWDLILEMRSGIEAQLPENFFETLDLGPSSSLLSGPDNKSVAFAETYHLQPGDLFARVSDIFTVLKSPEHRIIANLLSAKVITDELRSFLNLSKSSAMQVRSVGRNKWVRIEQMKHRACEILASKNKIYTVDELELSLLESLNAFIFSLKPVHRFVFISRLGVGVPRSTLEQIGLQIGVTRERVRQISVKCMNQFRMSVNCPPDAVKSRLQDCPVQLLPGRVPHLAKLFSNQNNLVHFLEDYCQEPGLFVEADASSLRDFFLSHPQPVLRKHLKKYLMEIDGLSGDAAGMVIEYFKESGLIREAGTTGRLFPGKLGLQDAVAHILRSCPYPMRKRQIRRLLEQCRFAKERPSERLDSYLSRLMGSQIWISGRAGQSSLYCHIERLPERCFDDEVVLEIGIAAHEYMETMDKASASLHDFHEAVFPEMNYYHLRHIIRLYAEDLGLHWTGKSLEDSFRIAGVLKERHTREERVMRLLHVYREGLSLREISVRMKMKNPTYAYAVVSSLAEQGKVSRVGSGLYMNTSAFKERIGSKTLVHVRNTIAKILSEEVLRNRTVHIPWLCREVNLRMQRRWSLVVFKSILNAMGGEWECHGDFIGFQRPEFANLAEVIRSLNLTHCVEQESVQKILKCIACTETSAWNALKNTKSLITDEDLEWLSGPECSKI